MSSVREYKIGFRGDNFGSLDRLRMHDHDAPAEGGLTPGAFHPAANSERTMLQIDLFRTLHTPTGSFGAENFAHATDVMIELLGGLVVGKHEGMAVLQTPVPGIARVLFHHAESTRIPSGSANVTITNTDGSQTRWVTGENFATGKRLRPGVIERNNEAAPLFEGGYPLPTLLKQFAFGRPTRVPIAA